MSDPSIPSAATITHAAADHSGTSPRVRPLTAVPLSPCPTLTQLRQDARACTAQVRSGSILLTWAAGEGHEPMSRPLAPDPEQIELNSVDDVLAVRRAAAATSSRRILLEVLFEADGT